MHYIIQLLAVILIGTAAGTLFASRNMILRIGSLVGIALGVTTIVTITWLPLASGTAVFILAHAAQRDKKPAT